MRIAHVKRPGTIKIDFHLNIPTGERIPRPMFRVFASSDNGRTGKTYIVTEVTKVERFHRFGTGAAYAPFAAVHYIAIREG